MQWVVAPVAVVAGSLMVVQAACNSKLEEALGRPLTVAVLSLTVGISAMLIIGGAFRQLDFPLRKAAQVPWWAWLGGICGATSLLSQPLAAPRLGAATYVGVYVTASIVASVIVDHFGWLGFTQHPAGLGRVLGCALMVGGIALVSLF